jgi:putative flippase GtrA
MLGLPSLPELRRLWRYYQVGIVNMAFGYGLFALFVKVGLNIYVAQAAAHVLGVIFNYFTYSRHAFSDMTGSRSRFVLSYAFNYLLSLATLAAVEQLIESPYLAGLVTVVFVSLLNYFVLKRFVFTPRTSG